MSELSFTFKRAAVEEEPGLPIFNLLEIKTSSSSLHREQGLKDRKRPAGPSKDSKKKANQENTEPSNRGPSKKPKTSESDADMRVNLKDLPIAKRVKEIGSGKVVSGMVKNIRNVLQPVEEMVDSTLLFKRGDAAGLYARLSDQGYLLLRDVLPRAKVLEGYNRILKHLQELKVVDGEGHFSKGSQKGYTIQASTGEVLIGPTPKDKVDEYTEGWREVCLDMAVQQVLNSDELLGVVSSLCRGKAHSLSLGKDSYSPLTLNPYFTWMRLKGSKEVTMEHADYFYWKRQTDLFISVGDDTMYAVAGEDEPKQDHLDIPCAKCGSAEDDGDNVILLCDECDYGIHLRCLCPPLKALPKGSYFCPNCTPRHEMGSVWLPFHDMTPEQSTLCVLPGSHRLPHYDKTLVKDGEVPKSFYGDEGRKLPWHVCPTLRAGDVVFFDLRLVQACTRNTSNAFRISADTRWYLKPQRENWGLTPSTRFVKAAAENRLVWKNEVVKEQGGGGEEDEEEDDEGSDNSEESEDGEEEEED